MKNNMNQYLKILSLLLLITICIIGCIPKQINSSQVYTFKISIKYTTLRFINQDILKANEVSRITNWVSSQIKEDQNIPINILQIEINKRIPWDELDYSEKVLLKDLIGIIIQYLETIEIDLGIEKDNLYIYITEVVMWIQETADEFIKYHSRQIEGEIKNEDS